MPVECVKVTTARVLAVIIFLIVAKFWIDATCVVVTTIVSGVMACQTVA